MNVCVAVSSGMWSFLGLLAVLTGLVMAGLLIVSYAEKRAVRRERLRKVQCGCAVRLVARPGGAAANGPTLRS